jgi:hypothetical protein
MEVSHIVSLLAIYFICDSVRVHNSLAIEILVSYSVRNRSILSPILECLPQDSVLCDDYCVRALKMILRLRLACSFERNLEGKVTGM